MNGFQTLLSIATCAAALHPGGHRRGRRPAPVPRDDAVSGGHLGRAVQVANVKIRVESAYGINS